MDKNRNAIKKALENILTDALRNIEGETIPWVALDSKIELLAIIAIEILENKVEENKEVMERAGSDVGLMFIAYTLKRIMNIIDREILKDYVRKLGLFYWRIGRAVKLISSETSQFVQQLNYYHIKIKTA